MTPQHRRRWAVITLHTAVSRHGLTTLRRGSTPPPATPARGSTPTVVATTRHSLTSSPPGTDPSLTAGLSLPPPRPGWPARRPQSRRPVTARQLDTQHETQPSADPHRREPLRNATHSTTATTRRLTTTSQTRHSPLGRDSQLSTAAGRRRHHSTRQVAGRRPGASLQPAGGGRPPRQQTIHSDRTASDTGKTSQRPDGPDGVHEATIFEAASRCISPVRVQHPTPKGWRGSRRPDSDIVGSCRRRGFPAMFPTALVVAATALALLATLFTLAIALVFVILSASWDSCQCDEPVHSCSHRGRH